MSNKNTSKAPKKSFAQTQKHLELPKDLVSLWVKGVRKFCKATGPKGKAGDPFKVDPYLQTSKGDIQKLWGVFNQERGDIGTYLKDANRQYAAYLLGFHLPNAARSLFTWERSLKLHPAMFKETHGKSVDIFDLGCGTAALSQSTEWFFHQQSAQVKSIHLIDHQRKMVENSHALTIDQERVHETHVQKWGLGIEAFMSKYQPRHQSDFAIVLLGNTINEWRTGTTGKVIKWLEKMNEIYSGNVLVQVIEPAQQEHCRNVMSLRNALCESLLFSVYPCQSQGKCPMLALPKDWCFSEWLWNRPAPYKKVDQTLKVAHQKLNASAFVFASMKLAKDKPQNTPLVVGRPLIGKGQSKKRSHLICDGEKLSKRNVQDGNEILRGHPVD